MSPTNKKTDNFLRQGSILAAATIIVRIIGMLYRIPMANIIGDGGNGIYAVAFDVYDIMLIISSYSLPLAVSKMVSSKYVNKEYRNANKIFRSSLVFAFIAGTCASLVLFFRADFIEKNIFPKYPGVAIPLRILAPTILVVAVMGVFRGFFQGKQTMIPTALSQIFEQIVNAIVSLYAAYYFMKAHNLSENIEGWGAAGGTFGTLMGAITAFAFLLFIYVLYRPIIRKQVRRDAYSDEDTYPDIYKLIVLTMVPIILSQTVYQISGVLDSFIFGNIMGAKALTEKAITELTGIYSTKYKLLLSVPIAMATALASSMIPSMVASFTRGELRELKDKVGSATKLNMIIAFPCTVGLLVLGRPIVQMLYPRADYIMGGNLLMLGSCAVIFFSLSSVSSAVLQSMNYMRIPVWNALISLVIHIALVFVLLRFTELGVYALVIGNVLFPLVVALLNWRFIRRHLAYKQELVRTFCVPFLSSVFMGIGTVGVYYGLVTLLHHNTVSVLGSILISIIVYFCSILLMKGLNKEELSNFPLGRTLGKIAEKLHLF